MRIACLCAPSLLPNAATSHAMAQVFAHQLQTITVACAPKGIETVAINWHSTDPTEHDAALVLGAWDYQESPNEFLSLIADYEGRGRPVFNAAATINWNIKKTYLRELETKGIRTIPTLWTDAPILTDVLEAFSRFQADAIVLKRQVGAGAAGQQKFLSADRSLHRRNPVEALLDRPGMIQPFMKSIQTEGEYSFIVIDGQLSHTVCKQAASGDYRIQPSYGGTSSRIEPTEADRTTAMSVLDALETTPLYARIDMVRAADNKLCLMELELIEPFLFPNEGPNLGPLMAAAIEKRLG